jgi:hypothetical protein
VLIDDSGIKGRIRAQFRHEIGADVVGFGVMTPLRPALRLLLIPVLARRNETKLKGVQTNSNQH